MQLPYSSRCSCTILRFIVNFIHTKINCEVKLLLRGKFNNTHRNDPQQQCNIYIVSLKYGWQKFKVLCLYYISRYTIIIRCSVQIPTLIKYYTNEERCRNLHFSGAGKHQDYLGIYRCPLYRFPPENFLVDNTLYILQITLR